jgi:hypothetical protein
VGAKEVIMSGNPAVCVSRKLGVAVIGHTIY